MRDVLVQLVRWVREFDPAERATVSEIERRWRGAGTRTVLTPMAAVSWAVVPAIAGFVVFGAWPAVAVGLVVAALLGWFSPPARVEQMRVDELEGHEWLVVHSDVATFTASVIRTRVYLDGGAWIAAANGQTYPSIDAGIPVLRFLDPFARWRLDVEPGDFCDPDGEVLATCCAVEVAGEPEGRTGRSAYRENVVDVLEDWGVIDPAGQVENAVERRLARRSRRRGRIELTPAGLLHVAIAIAQEREIEERGYEGAVPASATTVPRTTDELATWLREVLYEIARLIRETATVQALWVGDGHVGERQVQALLFGMLSKYASVAGVDLAKEADAGRGPVDFRFSVGAGALVLMEVKLMSSSRLEHGARVQLPAYLSAENCGRGFLLAVGFDAGDLRDARVDRLRHACTAVVGATVELVVVDARRRLSASKVT